MIFTGTSFNYLYVCHRKLWLFHHGIRPENENELVQLGRLLGEATFSRREKEIPIGEIGVLDWADFRGGVIHETKRGKSFPKGDEAQVRLYLWYLNKNGIRIHKAVIHYPERRETKNIFWEETMAEKVAADFAMCEEIVAGDIPPAERRACCKKCSYEELCFV